MNKAAGSVSHTSSHFTGEDAGQESQRRALTKPQSWDADETQSAQVEATPEAI